MKRLSLVLIALIMGCSCFTFFGCGKSEYPPETTFITLYHWDNGGKSEIDVVKKVCKAFEKTKDKIGVKVESISSYETQMKKVLASNNVPDVFLVPDGNFGSWVSTGAMLDLTDRIEASDKIDITKIWNSAVDRYRYNGKVMGSGNIYALPKDVTPYVMYYNKDLFKSKGVNFPDSLAPWSPEEATEHWKKFGSLDSKNEPKKDHIYGVGKIDPEGLIWSNGGDYLSSNRTEVLIDTPEVIEAFDYIQKSAMDDRTVCEPTILTSMSAKTLFLTGKAACLIEGRTVTMDLRKQATFDWDIAPVPAFEKNQQVNAWSGSVGYSVYSKSPQKDLAYELVEYFASPAGQLLMTEAGFSIPLYNDEATINKLNEIEAGKKPENTAEFLRAAEFQRAGIWQYLPSIRWKSALDDGSSVMFDKDASKRLTAEQYLTDVKSKIENIIRTDFPHLFV